jgi:hypothetical protein
MYALLKIDFLPVFVEKKNNEGSNTLKHTTPSGVGVMFIDLADVTYSKLPIIRSFTDVNQKNVAKIYL